MERRVLGGWKFAFFLCKQHRRLPQKQREPFSPYFSLCLGALFHSQPPLFGSRRKLLLLIHTPPRSQSSAPPLPPTRPGPRLSRSLPLTGFISLSPGSLCCHWTLTPRRKHRVSPLHLHRVTLSLSLWLKEPAGRSERTYPAPARAQRPGSSDCACACVDPPRATNPHACAPQVSKPAPAVRVEIGFDSRHVNAPRRAVLALWSDDKLLKKKKKKKF